MVLGRSWDQRRMPTPPHEGLSLMAGTLFVGDVHGCAAELSALLELAAPTRVILVGDLFTKGPDPAGVWALVQAWAMEAVRGNHDQAVLAQGGHPDLPPAALDWLAALPFTLEGPGWLVVHGGLVPEDPAGTTPHQAMNLRQYPGAESDPFWWELIEDPRLIIYGHDARRGLQDHRPRTLGLDSGCVYGKTLTGYLLEEDRLIQVPAARVHKPVD